MVDVLPKQPQFALIDAIAIRSGSTHCTWVGATFVRRTILGRVDDTPSPPTSGKTLMTAVLGFESIDVSKARQYGSENSRSGDSSKLEVQINFSIGSNGCGFTGG